ncbi:MFS transporter [Nocardioides cynanchi]|uniref:MFS transporter n=1 Tax=Nocardioides cynanchi TaxID=2558918 RepID=UPI00307DBA73
MQLATLALAMGGFAIGTTEFMVMGLLPQIADGVAVDIPTAGHLISAYALGVVVGAPILAVSGARLPRRALLVALMTTYAVANALSALAGSYDLLLLARFLDGVPHGAFFGVASLVAADLARPGRQGRAVAMVMLGLSVANVVGVPAATFLGQHLGWRSAFWVAASLSMLTVALILAFVPTGPGNADATGRRELRLFAEPQAWLTLLAGAIGFGGMFALYSYIANVVTVVGGLPDGAVPVFLLVFGLGMVAGTWVAGALADWSVFRSLLGSSAAMAVLLVAFGLVAPTGWPSLLPAFLVAVSSSVLVVNLQLRLMDVAGDAQTLGAAMNHSSLNIGNAVGAWLGGLVIAAGWGYRAPSFVGAVLAVAGLLILLVSARAHRRDAAAAAQPGS